MLTDEFKREPRYVVLKISDLEKYCSPQARIRVGEVSNFIRHARRFDGRPDLECVVVESDWPEFEPTWAAIEARMTSRAIEAEVLQAQEPKGDPIVELLAAQKPLEPEFAAVMQQCLDETLSEAPDATPQPPAPCPKCAKLEEENRKAQQEIAGDIVTIRKCDNLLKLSRAKVAEQAAEIERQTDFANNFAAQVRQQNETIASLRAEVDHRQSLLRESNRNCAEHAGVVWTQNVTIAQQAERIAELEEENIKRLETSCQQHAKIMEQAALIEKCEKALTSAVEWGAPMRDAPKSSRPYWFGDSVTALAAIAAHKKGGAQ